MSQWTQLAREGLWTNNPALVQLLGLCPLLAVSATVVNALGLALATLLVLVGASTTISLIRHQVPSAVRLPAFVMVIAAFVTCAEQLMAAFAYSLYQILGIFIPLIVTNCAILGRADAFARGVADVRHVGLHARIEMPHLVAEGGFDSLQLRCHQGKGETLGVAGSDFEFVLHLVSLVCL